MRTRGSKLQVNVLKRANLSKLYKSLNILSNVGWRVNKPVYSIIIEMYKDMGISEYIFRWGNSRYPFQR